MRSFTNKWFHLLSIYICNDHCSNLHVWFIYDDDPNTNDNSGMCDAHPCIHRYNMESNNIPASNWNLKKKKKKVECQLVGMDFCISAIAYPINAIIKPETYAIKPGSRLVRVSISDKQLGHIIWVGCGPIGTTVVTCFEKHIHD